MDAATTYSTRDAARILHVPEHRVSRWARMGGIVPKLGPLGIPEFTFQELLLLRTTRGLLEAGVPPRRVKRIWSTLKRQLSDDLPLTSIRILADGDRAIAWDGKAPWRPDSGQLVMDFAAGAVTSEAPECSLFEVISSAQAGSVEPLGETPAQEETPAASPATMGTIIAFPKAPSRKAPDRQLEEPDVADLDAEQWFRVGSESEADSTIEAREAYLKALDADPNFADAHTNLGRLDHRAGDLASAEARYRRAIQCNPDDATAHFNLGVLLEDRNCPHAAAEAYEQAIALDPEFADAHYNAGLLLEKLGQRAEALRHLMAAHRLYAR